MREWSRRSAGHRNSKDSFCAALSINRSAASRSEALGFTNCGSPEVFAGLRVAGSSRSWADDNTTGSPVGRAAGLVSLGRAWFAASGFKDGIGVVSEPTLLTGACLPVWLSGIGVRTIATDLDSGDRDAIGFSASLAVSIGMIEGRREGLGPDASGRSSGGPGSVELAGCGIIGVRVGEFGFAVNAGTGISGAVAFLMDSSVTGFSGDAKFGRAGMATAVSFMTGPPSDRSSTGSTVVVISAFALCCCIGAIAVARCDAANSPARKARLIGMLRLRRSATDSFQIHELQFLYHQGEAVGPLTGRHVSGRF